MLSALKKKQRKNFFEIAQSIDPTQMLSKWNHFKQQEYRDSSN